MLCCVMLCCMGDAFDEEPSLKLSGKRTLEGTLILDNYSYRAGVGHGLGSSG